MPKSAITVVPSPGTQSRLKSVTVSSRGNALLKNVSDKEAVPSVPGVAAVTGAAMAASPTCTTSALAGRRTAKPSSDWPPLPGPSLSSAVASLVDAAWTRTEDVALAVPDCKHEARLAAYRLDGTSEAGERSARCGSLFCRQRRHCRLNRSGNISQNGRRSHCGRQCHGLETVVVEIDLKAVLVLSGSTGAKPPRWTPL